jgi:hypothetical protein
VTHHPTGRADLTESIVAPGARSYTSFQEHPAYRALQDLRANPRVTRVRLMVPHDACPVCQRLTGEYPLDNVPDLPVEDCSHPLGCRSFYEPMLREIYP